MGQNDGASGSGRGVTQVATYPEEDKKMDCIPDGAFESTADREDRLAVREFPKRERPLDGKPDWVIMKEVEKDMTDMKNDVGDDQDQAGKVKRKLWTTYTRIRKSSYDLTSVTTRQLD